MNNKKIRVVLIVGICLVLLAVGGFLLTRLLPPPVEEEPPAPEPQPNPVVQPDPEPVPDPEPDPQPEEPILYEEDGKTYLELEGVKLLLVNKVYPLPADYGAEDPEARAALDEMIAAAAKDGINLFIVSGFRSYETQEAIYNRYVSQWGQEYTDTISARPGHSEHQAGLAYDLNSLESAFKNTEEYAWLEEHCAEYGFILRYLEDKTWATGYAHEPWHYRYIGDAALAKKIMESGLSLEEYAGVVTGEGQSDYISE